MKLFNNLRKFSLRKAGICSVTIGSINLLVHLSVLLHLLPYTWINGGRTLSYAAACSTSVTSMIITAVNILITLIASQIIPIKLPKVGGILLSIFLITTLPLSFLGVLTQLFGTPFEKCVMSLVSFIGFCADTRIAFEKRW